MRITTRWAVLVASGAVLSCLTGCGTRHVFVTSSVHAASPSVRGMSRTFGPSPVPLSSPVQAAVGEAAPCKAGTLVLSYDPSVAFQATGDRGDAFRIINRGSRACRLMGYPSVGLTDHRGALLPFHYTDGQSQYITKRRPQPVIVKPGSRAYVGVAKYRCDLGDQIPATTITMRLPGSTGVVSVSLTGRALNLAYCRGGPHDPGNTVGISPIEPAADRIQS